MTALAVYSTGAGSQCRTVDYTLATNRKGVSASNYHRAGTDHLETPKPLL